MGGVDFSKAPKQNISKARFTSEHKHLPRTTDISVKAMTDDAENKGLLALGGNTAAHKGDGGGQTPTPTPSQTGTPTSPPSTPPASHTPNPGHSGQGGGGTTAPPSDQSGGGGLANPGTQIAGIAGAALVLLAAGAGLVWWRCRRTTGAG